MKKYLYYILITKLLGLFLVFAPFFSVLAQKSEATGSEEKTLSPYFVVLTENPDLDQMPLKSTSSEISIAGVIADVKMRQVYINTGKKPLEALYVFPTSVNASVYAMQMQVGKRLVVAKVAGKDQARQRYEDAKAQGKTASLLEQERPNVFQMSVANIQPNDSIIVTMSYTELLVPEEGEYTFTYPTVVAPRYSTSYAKFAKENQTWIEQPFEKEGKAPTYSFDLRTRINAGMPIEAVTCSSHKISVTNEKDGVKLIRLDPTEKLGGNRDFILKYKLSGNSVQSGLLTYEDKKLGENFFLMMLHPPKRVELTQIPPREYVFLIDASASMEGFPINITKSLISNLLDNLRPTDYFNIMLFDNTHNFIAPTPLAATPDNLKLALNKITLRNAIGGTDILPALRSAFIHSKRTDLSKTFVVVTDGFISVEKEAFELIQQNLSEGNLFAFGIGTSVNRYLIEGMARMGMGEPFIATNEKEAIQEAEKFRKYIQTPVLTDVKVEFQGLQAYDVAPAHVPDMLAERPMIVFGKYKGKLQGNIKVTGKTGNGEFETLINTALANTQNNQALKYLWARHKIKELDDYNAVKLSWEQVEQVLNVGLKYHLLTNYTSFVAIDSTINRQKQVAVVKQAIPLPQGVSSAAIGSQQGSNIIELTPSKSVAMNTKTASNKRGSEGIRFALPDQSNLAGDSVVLNWGLLENISFKDKIEKYEVRIYDLSEELLFKQTSMVNFIIVNVNKDKLVGHQHLIVKVIPLDKNNSPLVNVDNSEGIAINRLEATQRNAAIGKANTSAKKDFYERLFEIAKNYENQQLWTDAMNTYETAIRNGKDRQKLKAEILYQEFLERNGMSLK